ncbi:MAG TPA: class I SAM-dependent methyltransferase, partial [Vicinamibacteria bacterium]
MADTVRDYYSSFGRREWMRLDSAEGTIEFATNCHYISTHLPVHARVLDIGGGPGRYALWLAERGHRVVLADVSPALLAIARQNVSASPASEAIEAIVEADARDLSHWHDGSFDAVLSMGPFYHLTEPGDRDCAARELLRVLRPHGTAFIALMPRYAFLRRTIALPDERGHLLQAEFLSQLLERGVFINDVPGRFTSGFGVLPDQITDFFE